MKTNKKTKTIGKEIGILAFAATVLILFAGIGAAMIAPQEEWNRTFGGTGIDGFQSVQPTSDGGYISAGRTFSSLSGNYDALLVKTNSSGHEEWSRTFGGTGNDSASSVHQTLDGGSILTGSTDSYGNGSSDFWLIKIDAFGNEQWNRTFGGLNPDYGYSVEQTSDGGYILAGLTQSARATAFAGWLIKIDAFGNEQWNRIFWNRGSGNIRSAKQTSDGGYILAGDTYSYLAGDFAWLIKTDPFGNEQWNRTFGGANTDYGYSAQETSDGGYILAGYTNSFGAGNFDGWLIKIDPTGNEQWNRTFGGIGRDILVSVIQTLDDGYALTGQTQSFRTTGADGWLIKTDPSGNEQWNRTFGGTSTGDLRSVGQSSDGSYILAGSISRYGNWDGWLIKVTALDIEAPVITVPSDVTKEATGVSTSADLGIATATDLVDGSVLVSNDSPGTFPVGTTIVTYTATDSHLNTATATQMVTILDTTAPVITVNGNNPETIIVGSAYVDAGAIAVDIVDGLVSVSLVNTVNAELIGTYSVVYTATDVAGNSRTAERLINVVGVPSSTVYNFSGILQPINADGSSVFKFGSTVPVKFWLSDLDGSYITDAIAKIYVAKISDGVVGTDMEAISTSAATTGNLFRYDGQYIFNLATKPLSVGTWQLRIELDDGTNHYVNIGLR